MSVWMHCEQAVMWDSRWATMHSKQHRNGTHPPAPGRNTCSGAPARLRRAAGGSGRLQGSEGSARGSMSASKAHVNCIVIHVSLSLHQAPPAAQSLGGAPHAARTWWRRRQRHVPPLAGWSLAGCTGGRNVVGFSGSGPAGLAAGRAETTGLANPPPLQQLAGRQQPNSHGDDVKSASNGPKGWPSSSMQASPARHSSEQCFWLGSYLRPFLDTCRGHL